MPTMTAIALEQLLEPSAGRSAPHKAKPPCPPDHHRDRTNITTAAAPAPSPSPRPYFISPALYATPDPAPLPDSPLASVSPSPYVVNRKGRRAPGPPARPASRLDGFEIPDIPLAGNTTAVGGQKNEEASLTAKCSVEGWGSASGLVGDGGDGLEKQEGDRDENLPTEEEEGKEEEEEEEEEEYEVYGAEIP